MNPMLYKRHVLKTARDHNAPQVENFLAAVPATELLRYAQEFGKLRDGHFSPAELAQFIRKQEFDV